MSIFSGFWNTARRLAERRRAVTLATEVAEVAEPAVSPTCVRVGYFNRKKQICEKDIPLTEYQALARLSPEFSLALNEYIEDLKV